MTGIRIDLSDLHAKLPTIATDHEGFVELVKGKIALDAVSNIILATPVDQGRARGNWQIGIKGNAPTNETATNDKSGSATIAAAQTEIGKAKGFDNISIVNNVPYIGVLNGGSSKQAPEMFVEKGIDAAIPK